MGDILQLVLKRLGWGVVTLLVISILIFGAVELLPGDIAQAVLGQAATPETVAPCAKRWASISPRSGSLFPMAGGALTGDFGVSLISGERVSEAISDRFVNTLFLACYAASSRFRSRSFSASSSRCCATRCSTGSPTSSR